MFGYSIPYSRFINSVPLLLRKILIFYLWRSAIVLNSRNLTEISLLLSIKYKEYTLSPFMHCFIGTHRTVCTSLTRLCKYGSGLFFIHTWQSMASGNSTLRPSTMPLLIRFVQIRAYGHDDYVRS